MSFWTCSLITLATSSRPIGEDTRSRLVAAFPPRPPTLCSGRGSCWTRPLRFTVPTGPPPGGCEAASFAAYVGSGPWPFPALKLGLRTDSFLCFPLMMERWRNALALTALVGGCDQWPAPGPDLSQAARRARLMVGDYAPQRPEAEASGRIESRVYRGTTNFRRLVTRYEYHADLFHGFTELACLIVVLARF